jgi:hypothetical protein
MVALVREGQVPNYPLPLAQSGLSPEMRSLKKRRFRNWKMMAIELAIAVLGFYVFSVTTVDKPEILGVGGVIGGIGALWLIQVEWLGVSIDDETLTMPTRRIPWMPALSFRRRTVLLSEVRRLIMSARWLGFEVVKIYGDFGSEKLIFGSKAQRRCFTLLTQRICPSVAVHRFGPR